MTKQYTFVEALNLARSIFYDLAGKKITFTFMSKDQCKFIFTAVESADIVKYHFPQFEIKEDVHKRRYAELVINYE